MRKYMLLFLLFFSTSAFAKDPMCWVTYDFKNNKAPLGIPPGQGSPINLELTPEEVVYASCKHQCYGFIPDHEEVIGVKSCTLDEIPIDKTKYFNIYKSSVNRICKVQVIGKYSHNLYITNSDSECKKEMENFIWCKMQENSCTYTYGQDPYK
jgi:hypothetical protein